MNNPLSDRWNSKNTWFRDADQRCAVGDTIVHRFADDRIQEECRYLMRLSWHLHMTYQEVQYEQLLEHVSPSKMARLNQLFSLISKGDYAGIDSWVENCMTLPIAADKWLQENLQSDYVQELLNNHNTNRHEGG